MVLQSEGLTQSRAYALPGGALLVGRSFIATVTGADVVQEPRMLEGIPEYINWDSEVVARVPALAAPVARGIIPLGTELLIRAGNMHGPGIQLTRTAEGWRKGGSPVEAPRGCLRRGKIRLEGVAEDGEATSCAVTGDDALWVVVEGVHSRLVRRPVGEPSRWFRFPRGSNRTRSARTGRGFG